MIIGVWTDIVSIEKIKLIYNKFGDRFLDKILTKEEKEYCRSFPDPNSHIAGKFAAKESVFKAAHSIEGLSMTWKDIEIKKHKNNAPYISLQGELKEYFENFNTNVQISISHSNSYAVGYAIIEVL